MEQQNVVTKGAIRAKDTGTQWRVSDERTVKTEVTKKTAKTPYGFSGEEAIELYEKYGTDAEQKYRQENGF